MTTEETGLPDYISSRLMPRALDDFVCWEWQNGKDKDGYGLIWWKGTTRRLSRVVFEEYNGAAPCGVVRHKCDNPPCANPAHLLDGTHQDNANDKVARGRSLQKEMNPMAKLTQSLADEMRDLYDTTNINQRQLACMFGVSHFLAGQVLRNVYWSTLGGIRSYPNRYRGKAWKK